MYWEPANNDQEGDTVRRSHVIRAVALAAAIAITASSGSYSIAQAKLASEPNDPLFPEQWSLENTGQSGKKDADIDALSAWKYTTGGPGVVIAIIDSGVAYDHPDLKGQIWANPGESGNKSSNGKDDDGNGYVDDWRGWDWVDNDNDPNDPQKNNDVTGHGSQVAGIAAATGNNSYGITGVSWNSRIMPLRVAKPKDGYVKAADLAEAINYATAKGANIVNISVYADDEPGSKLISDAIEASPKALFTVAAGNLSKDIDLKVGNTFYPCSFPAENIVCAGGTDKKDEFWKGSFLVKGSNYGTTSVDLAAPATNILSTTFEDVVNGKPTGFTFNDSENGTSLSSPMVAGTAALILTLKPELTPAQVKNVLMSTTDKLDSLKDKVASGGRLNAGKAVLKVANPVLYNMIYSEMLRTNHKDLFLAKCKYCRYHKVP